MSPSAKDAREAALLEQIRSLVADELKRHGQRAELRLDGTMLRIGHGAAAPRAEIQGTAAQWDNLPDDLRDKRIVQIAELLRPGPVSAPRRARSERPGRLTRRLSSLWAAAIVALTTGAVVLAYRYLTPDGGALQRLGRALQGAPSVSAPEADPERERGTRARAACELTRARVARGANIGPADVEGWAVELVLLRRTGEDLVTAPALSRFLTMKPGSSARTVTWPVAKSLTKVKRFDAEVAVEPLTGLGVSPVRGAKLTFFGPYVTPYFTEAQRVDYLMLADALAEAVQATDGALYARCIDSDEHHIGSWFLGATPGAAVSSVVYFMAGFSPRAELEPEVKGAGDAPLRAGRTFDLINAAAEHMDRSAAATLIGGELGMISGRANQPVRLTFPFRDANRATRASIAAARALKLAEPG